MLTNIQLQDQIRQETGKSILELDLIELTNIIHAINMSFVEQSEYEQDLHTYDNNYDYNDEYHYSANYTPLEIYEHEQGEERDYWESMMYARQEELTHNVSHINDSKLFSINSWSIEDENKAFREIWKNRLSE